MPGSTPPTSQLDWLSSTTAMIVLYWSKATRDLLKSFSWGIGALRQLFASDDGAISSPPAPYHLSASMNSPSNSCANSIGPSFSRILSRNSAPIRGLDILEEAGDLCVQLFRLPQARTDEQDQTGIVNRRVERERGRRRRLAPRSGCENLSISFGRTCYQWGHLPRRSLFARLRRGARGCGGR